MKKTLMTVAIAASFGLASASASAIVFNDFQVDPTYNGNTADAFTADKITGNYVESIVFNIDGTFDVRLRWVAGQFVADDGTNTLSNASPGIGGTGLGSVYGLYALYEGKGTFSTSGGITTFLTTPGIGSLNLYLDPFSALSQFAFTGNAVNYSNIFSLNGNLDDQLVATGTPQAGSGTLNPASCSSGGINCGSFGTSASILLTAFGEEFFIDPTPFYNFSFQSGQLNNFNVVGEQLINGSMDVVFNRVPEPASLALLGMGLIGLGMNRRRKVS